MKRIPKRHTSTTTSVRHSATKYPLRDRGYAPRWDVPTGGLVIHNRANFRRRLSLDDGLKSVSRVISGIKAVRYESDGIYYLIAAAIRKQHESRVAAIYERVRIAQDKRCF